MLLLKQLYDTLVKASKWKYFKVLNRKPVNKIHWAAIIIFSVINGIVVPYDKVGDKMTMLTSFGGLFFLHFSLNYYFLIYKKDKEEKTQPLD